MTTQALPYIVLLGFMYGSTLVASRFSVGQFEPLTYIGLRLTMAAMAHLIIYAVARQKQWPTDKWLWIHAIALGIFGTAIPMSGMVMSLQYLSSGVASIFITTSPAITVLFAHFLLDDERLTWRTMIGIGLALAGAILLALRGETGLADGSSSWIGYLLVLGPMLFGSVSTIYARKYMKTFDSFDVASIRMFTASLMMIPLSLLIVGFDLSAVTNVGYGALVYAAVMGTFGGMMLAFYNIKRFGATASSMVAYVVPIVANIGGILFLDEVFTRGMLFGTALIIFGIYIINRRQKEALVSQPAASVQMGKSGD
ncbi:MAG: drug/metabolite transporter (DMT)-like permease [Candidatus Promineifilaceae bacterium]|jgi:drug/metabolite transporter (DMT)-like permease